MSEMYSVCINKTTPHRFTVKLNCREQFTTTWKELHFYYIMYYYRKKHMDYSQKKTARLTLTVLYITICFSEYQETD